MHQYSNGHTNVVSTKLQFAELEGLPAQPAVTSERIKGLLSRALTQPDGLAPEEIREMAASVVFHLLSQRSKASK